MRLRTVLGGALGVTGLSVLAGRLQEQPPLPPALVGEQSTYRWRGLDVAYAEAGDPSDPDILLLHGIHAAATSQEFDEIWDHLAAEHHVIAPDLPGFGCSDRPPLKYTDSTYRDFVADFTADLTEKPLCIATSLTGAYVADVGDERFSELVLVCPTDETGRRRPWLRSLFRTRILGELLYRGLTVKRSLWWWAAREGYDDSASLDERIVEYLHRTARQPGARYAPASFVAGYLTPEYALDDTLATLDVSVTLIWGREATRPPVAVGRRYEAAADASLLIVDDTRLLPHAERPDAFLEALRRSGCLDRLEPQEATPVGG